MNKLQSYLKGRGISQARFAEQIGVNQATISKLCAGALNPSLSTAYAIERATGGEVPASVWVEDAA